jgi:hypothetical protein
VLWHGGRFRFGSRAFARWRRHDQLFIAEIDKSAAVIAHIQFVCEAVKIRDAAAWKDEETCPANPASHRDDAEFAAQAAGIVVAEDRGGQERAQGLDFDAERSSRGAVLWETATGSLEFHESSQSRDNSFRRIHRPVPLHPACQRF